MCPSNWKSDHGQGTDSCNPGSWDSVEKVELIDIDTKTPVVKIGDPRYYFKIYPSSTESLISFFYDRTYAQRSTYIWMAMDDEVFGYLYEANGDKMLKHDLSLSIDLLLGRPVVYVEGMEYDTIEFRAYK